MGVYFYLVNITKKVRVAGNYGKWDEFNPLESFDQAKKEYQWNDEDECAWISDEGDIMLIPLKDYVWRDPCAEDYDENAALDWFVNQPVDDDNYEKCVEMIRWPEATKATPKRVLQLKKEAAPVKNPALKPQCTGRCKNGSQCKRDASPKSPENNLCWQHM